MNHTVRRALSWLCLATIPAVALAAPGFTLDSPALHAGASMPLANVYGGCGGGNQSPRLHWQDPPAGTKSYAVTMYDPDASGGFWHWIAFDIPIGAQGLNAGAGTPHSGNAPGDTVQLKNDFGNAGYSGPCPPPGAPHHYVITVYALEVPELGLAAHFSRKDALAAIERHALARAALTVTWGH
ncbi:MAG TPA: YbhB/YbcL family Raf kinase inhibitor-like protein [Rhodanobacteraceae bacterium]|nr:YbhB/YbcL family Raf kinase inhibitor-like protein [Rhodanobacteraceae bacterium]